ncbi:MAG TPA: hypothetical protein VGR73_03975 [Bryobacteraceae bacterium]|nr:hypothetical protein [Bryobacteraceae bacterium]
MKAISSFFLAALFCGPARGAAPPQPGTINYVEGQASLGEQTLAQGAAGTAAIEAGQILTTQDGRAEILLTPGIFFRIGNNSAVQMNSSGLANTILTLQRGRALVEVANILPENNVVINEKGASTRLLKPGLYDFDADLGVLRVYDGKAFAQSNGRQVEVKGGRQLNLTAAGKPKAQKFDKSRYEDDFYRWASLRSSYLTEANADAASRYAGSGGYSADLWYGTGWYWDPWFDAYTFIPGDGIFYSPFGWGFYSPWYAFGAPYLGYYGGYHHFGPGYRPRYGPGGGAYGFGGNAYAGHAYSYGGTGSGNRTFGGFRGGNGGMRGGGFRGGGGGFHSGGGFHGGGGGGSHGGGGGGSHGGGGGGHR